MKKKSKKPVKKSSESKRSSPRMLKGALNATGVQPLGDRVLVKPMSAEEMGHTTSFSIIIPDTVNKEKSDRGTVVAIGKGKKNEKGERVALEVSVGDKVLYTKPWNDPVKIGGVEYYLVAESDILAVIK